MTIPILPDRHTYLKNSLLGMGAILIANLDEPKSVTQLWHDASLGINYEIFILTLDFLYIIRAVEIKNELLILTNVTVTQDNNE